MTIVLNTKY